MSTETIAMLDYVLAAVAVVVLLIVAFVVAVSLRPAEFRVSRSAAVDATPQAAFGVVNDLHAWEHWSPWAKLDPTMKITYDGPPTGAGASYAWSGNGKVGAGSMTISESQPSELIRMKLAFVRPFAANNDVEFTFKAQGHQTVVTWTMTGKNNFMFKAFSLVMSMDKMVGGDFEKGLTNLKALLETPKVAAA